MKLFAALLALASVASAQFSAGIPATTPASGTVVFYGSSVCSGTGASTYANSASGLLTAALPSYTFYNKATPGESTTALLAGFASTVAPLRPQYVIICPSIFNETGGSVPTLAAYQTFTTNVAALMKRVEAINAVPIIWGAIPNGSNYAGTVNTATTAVTSASGNTFPTNGSWTGRSITINSVSYTIASVTDSTHLTLTATAGTQSGVNYTLTGGFTAAGCSLVKDMEDYFGKLDVEVWDRFDALIDPAAANGCAYQQPLDYGDGIHPNDAGHAAIFASIPISYFDVAHTLHNEPLPASGQSWVYGTDVSNTPFALTPSTASSSASANLSSWTQSAWIQNQFGTGSKALMHVLGSTGPLRVRNVTVCELIATGLDISANASCIDGLWHHIVVTYNYPSNNTCFYVDGQPATGTQSTSCSTGGTQFQGTQFNYLGRSDSTSTNCVTCSMALPALYRTTLRPDQVQAMYGGRAYTASLEFMSNLGAPPRVSTFNFAQTSLQGAPFSGTNGFTLGVPFNPLSASVRTAAIGGGALTASCATGTVTITGAQIGDGVTASPNADITTAGATAFSVWARISSANTATVYVCGTGTPTSTTYTVRLLP